ncbi:hypothetical protein TNCV_899721 [Trichonephila clavipes]|nr:hypothetical protein TNCV_899721 [Trichonephila clavipes]
MRAFDDGPRNLEPRSSDEDGTRALSPPLLTSSPTRGSLSPDIFNVHRPLCTAVLQRYLARTHDMPATSPLLHPQRYHGLNCRL